MKGCVVSQLRMTNHLTLIIERTSVVPRDPSSPAEVAEIMDRVLAVTTGPAGSTARWLGGSERDEPIAEDVEASLLT